MTEEEKIIREAVKKYRNVSNDKGKIYIISERDYDNAISQSRQEAREELLENLPIEKRPHHRQCDGGDATTCDCGASIYNQAKDELLAWKKGER